MFLFPNFRPHANPSIIVTIVLYDKLVYLHSPSPCWCRPPAVNTYCFISTALTLVLKQQWKAPTLKQYPLSCFITIF